ncbi:MAG: PQQ-dependent catabolism-associated CXXCW motif protein [Pseudomonadota bacterium]|nr:PQQ-dependent catabolism-associated CXXCW motif protein [Pseudomonadota bacterium]
MRKIAWLAGLWLALGPSAFAAPAEPDGYRMESYRAPTPETLRGASVLTTEQARELWRTQRGVFIDVLPQAPRPQNLPKDVVWRDPPRDDIPGSLWLPDTGYGALAPEMTGYFTAGVKKAAHGDATLVFYCQRACWMSWNAAKRALALGFAPVAWYPEGVDGWREAGFALEARKAEPRP